MFDPLVSCMNSHNSHRQHTVRMTAESRPHFSGLFPFNHSLISIYIYKQSPQISALSI